MAKKNLTGEWTSRIAAEYEVLHQVAKILQNGCSTQDMLQQILKVITRFDDLKVERKAGIFLADEETQVLRLFATIGEFSEEFLDTEKVVPFGECLCGRVAVSGELLMSESCFTDSRHERKYSGMTPHGHYIVPLKSRDKLVGVLFLYTDVQPSWYRHSQEVLISIGGLIADAIEHSRSEERLKASCQRLEREISERQRVEEELINYRNDLEALVESRTQNLMETNAQLKDEVQERKLAEDRLRSMKEKLRLLNNRIQNVREEEKTRISRQVHDELGQSLTALKMDVTYLERKIPGEQLLLLEKTRAMKELIDSTVKSVQMISMNLRPPILDAFGICEAIAWQADEYRVRTGIEFDLNCLNEHVSLSRGVSTTLFRVFQEMLTNIIRHAEAGKVQISLNPHDDQLTLEVKDNGKGIEAGLIDNPKSLGLLGIQERVRNLGGEFTIKGSPGKGTTATVRIPCKSDDANP
ncbi:MAG: hypothetical protein NPINA01_02400 [Nitrospinaceae bacterium]|nr:MAG: hypothetical protein NPINA01_02400 [Nitrospinaceae bacterium]